MIGANGAAACPDCGAPMALSALAGVPPVCSDAACMLRRRPDFSEGLADLMKRRPLEAPAAVDRFVACSWACGACGENGQARPWCRPGETPVAAAARFSRETRGRCVEGCAFVAELEAGGNHGGR